MIDRYDLLLGGALPAVVAAVVLALVWRATGKAASAWRTAVVVGYVVGHWALDARTTSVVAAITKSYRPNEVHDWLPSFLLLAIIPDAVACCGKFGPAVGWVLRIALCLIVPWRFANGTSYIPTVAFPGLEDVTGAWSTGEAVAWIGGIGAAFLLTWLLTRCESPSKGVIVSSVLATIVALGGAITVALSASLFYGQLLGVLAATLGGCGVVSGLLGTGRGPEAVAGPVVIAFGSIVVLGLLFAELKLHNAILLLLAMNLAISWLPQLTKLAPSLQLVGRCGLCLAVLVTAVSLAKRDFSAKQEESASDPYQNFLQ